MAVSRAERRSERKPRVETVFDDGKVEQALDLLELVEFAWHDCFGEVTPPPPVVEDMLTFSGGSLEHLIEAALLAITDWRDLKLAAEARRNRA